MHWSVFQLAKRVARHPKSHWLVMAIGILTGLLAPALMVLLGLLVQLQIQRSGGELAGDGVLGALLHIPGVSWPYGGNRYLCLLILVGLAWLVAAFQTAGLIYLRRAAHRSALSIAADLRHKIYTQAFRLGPYELLGAPRTRPDELFSERVETVRRGFTLWWTAVPYAVVAWLGLLAVAAWSNGWLTLLAVLLGICLVRANALIRANVGGHHEQWRALVQRHDQQLREALHVSPLLKSYSLVEPPMESFESGLQRSEQAELQLVRGEYLVQPILLGVLLATAGFLILVIGLGAGRSDASTVLVCTALLSSWLPFSRLRKLPIAIREMDRAADEICAFLDREPSVVQLADAKVLGRVSQAVLFDRVNLADRNGRHFLEEVSLRIPSGKRVVFVATDAQAPHAIAGLFVRFYDPTAGRVLFDDQDVRRASLDSVRAQAALVFRDGLLFADSVARNVTCGETTFTTQEINEALKKAVASSFVHDLPNGLATRIGDDTCTLQPDQAFRIGLARALLRNPSLLLVEEPPPREGSELEIEEALQAAGAGRILVILPSRIQSLRSADSVFVFHEGKLVGEGTHSELLQASELYRHLCYIRFNPLRTIAMAN